MKRSVLLRVLANSLLAGNLDVEEAAARLAYTLGRSWRWVHPLAQRYVHSFSGRTRPHRREVVHFLAQDTHIQDACAKYAKHISVAHWTNEPQVMQPAPAAANWDLPIIESIGDLAAWLGIGVTNLLWLADLKGLTFKINRPPLQHYHRRMLLKPSGGIRLIETPKPRLKDVQRQVLFHILNQIPSHPAVHGFVRGHSIKTFVEPHVGRRVLLRMDMQDFFPTFSAARIATFFRIAGYPETVADLLAGLCTTTVPRRLWTQAANDGNYGTLHQARDLYSRPHLPQGAPTSPALANICSYRLDCRLTGLAKSVGAKYSRYADDLAFSGDAAFEKRVDRFTIHVAALLIEEGFSVNHRKTRVMRQGVRQHLAGIVTNQRANVMRGDFDRLKATLTNCVRHSPASQNREAHPDFRSHLQGRIAFVESIHPARGQRLRTLFNQVQWP